MTDPSGYGDSPQTVDGTAPAPAPGAGPDEGATLTTDEEAQRDDSIMRPGNEPD